MKRFGMFLLDTIAAPIPVRELRATFRGWRFVIIFSAALALALFILWMTSFGMEQEGNASSSIGQGLFAMLVTIQAAIIALLVPGFAGTSVVREKDKQTLELLSTTSIQPWQIIWGQLLAAMGYVAVFLFATLPLMALPFWYGGLSGWEPVVAYAALFLFAALIAMWSLYASATSATVARATGTSYLIVFLLGFPIAGVLAETVDRAMRGRNDLTRFFELLATEAGYITLDTLFLFAAPFAFLFIVAVNRLKPWGSNRATALRIFGAAFLPAAAGILLLNLRHFLPVHDREFRLDLAFSWLFIVSMFGTLFAFFCSDAPVEGKRLFKQLNILKGPRTLLRPFFPGGRRGWALALGVSGVCLLVFIPLLMRVLAWDAADREGAAWIAAYTVLAQLVFACGLALWAGSLPIPAGLSRALVAFAIGAVPIGSAVWQYAAYSGFPLDDRLAWDAPGWLCFPWVLYKCFRGYAQPNAAMPVVGNGVHAYLPFWIFHTVAGVFMAVAGSLADRQRENANRERLITGEAPAAPPAPKPAADPVEAAP